MKLKSHWWWDLTARDFAALDMGKYRGGAAGRCGRATRSPSAGSGRRRNQHRHPRRAVAMMDDGFPALCLPMMPVGKSNEHLVFAGTLILSYETPARLWYEICEGVHRAGLRKVLFF
jgi:creatinine amidohydrolase